MRRREFIALAGSAAASALLPRAAFAQQPAKVPHIGVLGLALIKERVDALREGLAAHGYIDAKTIAIDWYWSPTTDQMPAYAAMAVTAKPDVIVCTTTPAALAAKNLTTAIPIVLASINDPVGNGLIASLAHPGGNVTGSTNTSVDLVPNQLELLKELVPNLRRLAVLNVPADPSNTLIVAQLRAAASALNIELVVFDFIETQDFNTQLDRVASAGVQAFYVVSATYLNSSNTDASFQFELRTKIPRMNGEIIAGPSFRGVMAYQADTLANYRQVGDYVDQILNGVKPADLPVQQPTRFNLAVNMATARAIGITIPTSILARATLVDDEDYRLVR
jgi:putative ABC transport system substrate-binding protein